MPINLIIRNPLDRDAREFIQRAGVTDAGGRAQLNQFVRGIKTLGLWSSMVCWPLRSTQNAGTGTTAYSLGGLGTFNGTLTNGPTWGTDGLTLDGINDYVDFAIIPATAGNITLYLAHKPTADKNSDLFGCRASGVGEGFEAGRRGATTGNQRGQFTSRSNNAAVSAIIAGAESLNAFHAYAYLHDAGNKKAGVMVDAFSTWTLSSALAAAPAATNSTLKLGTVGGTNAANASPGEYSMLAQFQGVNLAEAQVASLHDIYKATLGTGLGLP
jgi:hypothetical protein